MSAGAMSPMETTSDQAPPLFDNHSNPPRGLPEVGRSPTSTNKHSSRRGLESRRLRLRVRVLQHNIGLD